MNKYMKTAKKIAKQGNCYRLSCHKCLYNNICDWPKMYNTVESARKLFPQKDKKK